MTGTEGLPDQARGPEEFLHRLVYATNGHDIDELAACFASDYVNVTPAHPARSFTGRDRVRANWQQIFAFVPDVAMEVVGWAASGDSLWVESRMHGTRRDGTRHEMHGVVVFTVADGCATAGRFFLEPLDEATTDVAGAVNAHVHGTDQ